MVVMCICETDGLTVGNWYTVYNKEENGYFVQDDNGNIDFYWSYYFVE